MEIEDPVAIRRLFEREEAREQVDSIRRALGCRVGESLGTQDIVALLQAAKVTGDLVDAVELIRTQTREKYAAEFSVIGWLCSPPRRPIHEAHRLRSLGLVDVLWPGDTREVRFLDVFE